MTRAHQESHRRHPLPWIVTLGGTIAFVGLTGVAADRAGFLPGDNNLPARDQSQAAAGQPRTSVEIAQEYASRLMESPRLREWRNSLPDDTPVTVRTYLQPVTWQVPIPEHISQVGETRGAHTRTLPGQMDKKTLTPDQYWLQEGRSATGRAVIVIDGKPWAVIETLEQPEDFNQGNSPGKVVTFPEPIFASADGLTTQTIGRNVPLEIPWEKKPHIL